jgi:hypothetical protein
MVQAYKARGLAADLSAIADVHEGMVFDLGTYRFRVYALPGHSAGSVMLFDHAKGLLIAGDAVGSNKAGPADALWMQMPSMAPIDRYLSARQVFRAKVAGRIKLIYGGHNDWPLLGETYLDNLQAAAQHLVDAGPDSLVPSLRPAGVWMAVRSDRLSNPDWASINVHKDTCLSQPHTHIASLSNIVVQGGMLDAPFVPTTTQYRFYGAPQQVVTLTPVPTSPRITRLTINGVPVQPGVLWAVDASRYIEICVTAPDGVHMQQYTLHRTDV